MKKDIAAYIAAYIRHEILEHDKTADDIDEYMILDAIAAFIGGAR